MFFESFSKGPRGLHYVLLITCKFPTSKPVDGLTFVFLEVLVLGETSRFLIVLLPLFHCRCWSMWVGFLYTVIDSLPSASGLTIVSILLVVFHCKPYGWVNIVNVFRYVLFVIFLLDENVSPTYLNHFLGVDGWVAVLSAFCSKYSM